jgi:hypothetical protein
VVRDATAALNDIRRHGEDLGVFLPDNLEHRRGKFPLLFCGVSYGGGQHVSLLSVLLMMLIFLLLETE